jgi:hypothetical protein
MDLGFASDYSTVILTGAGGEFITGVDWSSFGDVADPGVWSQVHDEGVQVLGNIANIRVPVIAAIEGCAHVHSDYALLASVIVAAEGATFGFDLKSAYAQLKELKIARANETRSTCSHCTVGRGVLIYTILSRDSHPLHHRRLS